MAATLSEAALPSAVAAPGVARALDFYVVSVYNTTIDRFRVDS